MLGCGLSNPQDAHMLCAMNEMAKGFMFFGAGLFLVGLLLFFGGRLPWFGQLPGILSSSATTSPCMRRWAR